MIGPMTKTRTKRQKNISGEAISAIRKAKGITQSDLADKVQAAGVSLDRAAIAKIETGRRAVLDYELVALSRCLRCSISTLIE